MTKCDQNRETFEVVLLSKFKKKNRPTEKLIHGEFLELVVTEKIRLFFITKQKSVDSHATA